MTSSKLPGFIFAFEVTANDHMLKKPWTVSACFMNLPQRGQVPGCLEEAWRILLAATLDDALFPEMASWLATSHIAYESRGPAAAVQQSSWGLPFFPKAAAVQPLAGQDSADEDDEDEDEDEDEEVMEAPTVQAPTVHMDLKCDNVCICLSIKNT